MVDAYWVPELKHQLVSPQYLHTEEGNPMLFKTHSGFYGENRFTKLMANPNVKGHHRQTDLQTNKMQYNLRNNLPIHSAQLIHDQQWTVSILEAAIFETRKHNKNLTAAQRELLKWHFRLVHIGFSHVHFLARNGKLPVNNPKALANCDKVKCAYC